MKNELPRFADHPFAARFHVGTEGDRRVRADPKP
jgi:hypothetical protein